MTPLVWLDSTRGGRWAGVSPQHSPRDVADPSSQRARDRLWTATSCLLLVVLGAASVFAGLTWRADVARERAAVFKTTASAVASSVVTSLLRQTDLTTVEQALVALHPDLDNTEYAAWFEQLAARDRYPGSLGFGFVRRVPAGQLPEFVDTVTHDQTKALKISGAYAVVPAGQRAEYCLARLAVWLGPSGQLPPTLDYCAATLPGYGTSPTAKALASARDSGQLTLASPVIIYPGEMFAFAPVYDGGKAPTTVDQRRANLLGWVAATFDGRAIIAAAQAGHPEMHVAVLGGDVANPVVLATSGTRLTGKVSSLTVPVSDGGTWSVQVTGRILTGGASPDAQGTVVAALGVAISVLIFGMLQVLLRSRGRALRLVREQTEELRHRALHDDLTGLPNRALIMDRIGQLAQRARRNGTAAAVLFIDLDSFKDVNDTYGHAVGDALLRAVAARLNGCLRTSDTAGRIGGDEFVVLVEGTSLTDGGAAVAERLLDALHRPYQLDELPEVSLRVNASIGVAVSGASADGVPVSRGRQSYETGDEAGEELLRNADIALYDAKAAGKDRYAVFAG
jgi:diguanylate cyclase (GGDEF)-like protein